MDQRDFQRILIIKPSSFGDVIHALPVLNGLRKRYPKARISWLVSTACMSLLEHHPQLDEVLPFDRKRYGRIGRDGAVTLEFIAYVRRLYERHFDLVVDLQGLFRSGFFSLASGAKTRIGFSGTRELASFFYSHRIKIPTKEMHAVDRYYLVADLLGFGQVPIEFLLPVNPEARVSLAEKLADRGLEPGQPYALIGPGTRWETKQWPAEHFAALARTIRTDFGLPVVLSGAPDEAAMAERVQQLAGEGVINLAGQTSIPEMVALVAGTRVAVMNDTGPMHLAVALGRPLVTLYGPTNPTRTGPYGRDKTVARLELACSPCYRKKLSDCPHGHRCMRELTPDMVAERVAGLLAEEAVNVS